MTPMLSQLPIPQLMAELLNPNSTTPKFAVLSAIQKAQERMRMSQAAQGMAAQQAVAQQPGTVAQEILAAGIGSQPYEFAGGGLVAFADGGMTAEEPPLTMGNIEAVGLSDQMAFGVSPEFGLSEPVETSEFFLSRIIREARERKQREEEARREEWLRRESPVAVERRDAPPRPATAFERPPYEQRGVVPAPRPASAASTARPGTARPGAGRTGTPPPAAATPDDIAQYTTAAESAIGSMMGRGVPSAEELELRKALLAAQEAERLSPMEYQQPRGLTGREMLQLASFDPTKGRWVQSLAEKAAGVTGAREAKAEEVKKANREIDIANRRLNTALAQQRLAYASSDRKAKEDADVAVANARVALREKVIDFGLRSRQVGAQERQARAAEAAAQQRGEFAGTRADAQRDKQIRDVIADVQKRIPVPSALTGAARQRLIDQQIAEATQQLAPFGVSREQVMQYFGVAGVAAPAGTQVLRFDAQGNPIR